MERKFCTNCVYHEQLSFWRRLRFNTTTEHVCWHFTKSIRLWSPIGENSKVSIADVHDCNKYGDCKIYLPTFWRRIVAFLKREIP